MVVIVENISNYPTGFISLKKIWTKIQAVNKKAFHSRRSGLNTLISWRATSIGVVWISLSIRGSDLSRIRRILTHFFG